jgi:hypothetical protein
MLTAQNAKTQKYELRSRGIHRAVSLVMTFEDFNLANQQDIPEDKYP